MHFSTDKTITLFTPLSGRSEFWSPYSKFLDEIKYEHSALNLIFMDTSQSPNFEANVKSWIKKSDFQNIRYIKKRVGSPGLADVQRIGKEKSTDMDLHFEIHKAMCKIYNTMKRVVKTELVWVVEDDIIPPQDVLTKLLSHMKSETVSVSAAYRHRFKNDKIVAWSFDNSLLQPGSGVTKVKGNGFGCVLMKMNIIRQHVFTPDRHFPGFDRAFYHRLEEHEIVLLDQDIRCKHLSPVYIPEKCPHSYESHVSSHNFDEQDYINRYPDVENEILSGKALNAYEHYENIGKREGRIGIPREAFDEEYYLHLYPDVRKEINHGKIKNGLEHYLKYGAKEGRYSRIISHEHDLNSQETVQLQNKKNLKDLLNPYISVIRK
jgi:hypothetical protein